MLLYRRRLYVWFYLLYSEMCYFFTSSQKSKQTTMQLGLAAGLCQCLVSIGELGVYIIVQLEGPGSSILGLHLEFLLRF